MTPAILEDVSGQDTSPPPKLTHVGQSPLKAEALSVSPRKLTRRKLIIIKRLDNKLHKSINFDNLGLFTSFA